MLISLVIPAVSPDFFVYACSNGLAVEYLRLSADVIIHDDLRLPRSTPISCAFADNSAKVGVDKTVVRVNYLLM